jgi:hypothetical protein
LCFIQEEGSGLHLAILNFPKLQIKSFRKDMRKVLIAPFFLTKTPLSGLIRKKTTGKLELFYEMR